MTDDNDGGAWTPRTRQQKQWDARNKKAEKVHLRRLPQQTRFLDAFRACASVKKAAELAHIDPKRHYTWLEQDEIYAKAWLQSQPIAAQSLEDEAVRRAMHGVSTPKFWQGRPLRYRGKVVMETEYSDQLLIALLKRFRPELYRDASTSITNNISIGEKIIEARQKLRQLNEERQLVNGHDSSEPGAANGHG